MEVVRHPRLTRKQQAKNLGIGKTCLHEVLAEPETKGLIKDLLAKAGATNELVAKRLAEGLSATETKVFSLDGEVIESDPVVDFGERRQYARLVAELSGQLDAEGSSSFELFAMLTEDQLAQIALGKASAADFTKKK